MAESRVPTNLSDSINALPQDIRDWIMELEANSPIAGYVQDIAVQKENVAHLSKLLAEVKEKSEASLSAQTKERDGWVESAAQFSRNADFYQGLVSGIGAQFGEAANISDDGSRQQDVLCLKVPELVAKALSELAAIRKQLTEEKAKVGDVYARCFNRERILKETAEAQVKTLTAQLDAAMESCENAQRAQIKAEAQVKTLTAERDARAEWQSLLLHAFQLTGHACGIGPCRLCSLLATHPDIERIKAMWEVVEAAKIVDGNCPEGFDGQENWTNEAHRKLHIVLAWLADALPPKGGS